MSNRKAPEERVTTWPQITARIPPEVARALRIRAAEEGRSRAIIVEEALRRHLAPPGKPGGKA
jgi:plasmid stability protein